MSTVLPPAVKLCECGCGGRTNLALGTDRRAGKVKGQPQRFIRGHASKINHPVYERVPGDDLCACGCGGTTPIATRTDLSTGRLAGRPMQFIHGHNNRSSPVDYIEQDCGYLTPCWVWQLSVLASGYGQVWDALRRKMRAAHIVNYEREHGAVPQGLELDHLCRTRACCNPAHLEAVTHAENVRRGWIHRRAAQEAKT